MGHSKHGHWVHSGVGDRAALPAPLSFPPRSSMPALFTIIDNKGKIDTKLLVKVRDG